MSGRDTPTPNPGILTLVGAIVGAAQAIQDQAQRQAAAAGHPAEFTCPRCCRQSWNPNDRRWGYCGACHDFTGPEDRTMEYDVGSGGWR